MKSLGGILDGLKGASAMADPFDPYHRWLGIPSEDQPPHHYRLLGIAVFEPDRQVIDSVAMRHISFLQEITDAASVRQAQQLLNELAAARRCLLDPAKKAAYDAALQEQLAAASAPPRAAPPEPPIEPAGAVRTGSESDGSAAAIDPACTGVAAIPAIRADASRVARRRRIPVGGKRAPKDRPALATRGWRIVLGATAGFTIMIAIGIWSGRTGSERSSAGRNPEKTSPTAAQPAVANSLASIVQAGPADAETPRLALPGGPAEASIVDSLPPLDFAGLLTDVAAGSDPSSDRPSADVPLAVPLQIDGLVLWLDAADGASLRCDSARGVERWLDKSGGGFAAEVEDKTQRPLYRESVLGSQPAVQFSGAESFSLSGTSAVLNLDSQYTLAYVAAGGGGPLLSKGSGESPRSLVLVGAAGLRIGGVDFSAAGDSGGSARLRTILADQHALRWFIDGSEHQVHADGEHAINNTSLLRIGRVTKRGGSAEPLFQGYLAELLIYNRPLEQDQRRSVDAYLSEKWLSGEAPPPLSIDPPQEPSFAGGESESGLAAESSPGAESSLDTESDSAMLPAAAPTKQRRAPAADDWQQGFVPLLPVRLEASAASKLDLADGGIVLADGAGRQNEQYRIAVAGPLPPITALRLEALPHPSLPGMGPGWGIGGRFSLAEVRVRVASADPAQRPQPVSLFSVVAGDPVSARRLIDDNDATSWTISRRGERVVFTFLPAAPIDCPEGSWLSVSLHQRENLGCFRLGATSASEPLALADQPPSVADAGDSGVLFVNFGGDSYIDADGNRWEKSQDFMGQGFGHENGRACSRGAQPYPQQPWAETAIRGLTGFRAVLPDGSYELTFCFCEQWTRDADSRRFFTVVERGTPHALEIRFRGAGLDGPWMHQVRATVRDGQLDIDFHPFDEKSHVVLNGLIIRPRSAAGRR